ncbi:hypothetical protein [Natronorarus salvus]|uniref:hypothetical protein n=1 Tax=Natronorarus salvus TaxID=3117733 RepID=UPI002F26BD5D
MKKPATVDGPSETLRWYLTQMWRDMLSVYYANTPVWRWLKSGALLFLGLCAWAGGAVLLSVRPDWTFLYFVMAYGFLLLFWGPLTHFVIVPLVLELRRSANSPFVRTLARNGGKINLSVFFTLVIVLALSTPGFMLLDFGSVGSDEGGDVRGELRCEGPVDDLVTCEVHDTRHVDHVVAIVEGEVIAEADEPPYRFEVGTDQLRETEAGYQFAVEYRDEDGDTLRRQITSVRES